MVVVAILVVLCATVSMVVASSTIFGTRQTAQDRSRLQALAAAEGGRDATLAYLQSQPISRTCPEAMDYPRTGDVGNAHYEVYVYWSAPTTPATTVPSALSGCLGEGQIRIRSVGTAQDGTTKTVIGAYHYTPQTTTPTSIPTTTKVPVVTTSTATAVTPGGLSGAIVQGEGGALNADIKNQDVYNSAGSLSAAPHDANIILRTTGGLTCNTAEINGDVVITQAKPTQLGGSAALGSVLDLKNCTIHGNVYAYADISLNNSTVVDGDVESLAGTIDNSGTIGGQAWAFGAITGNGTSNATHASQGDSIAVPSSMSGTTTWQEYAFAAGDWSGWSFAYLGPTRPAELPDSATQLSATCDASAVAAAVNKLTSKTVIDATGCSDGLSLKNSTLTLQTKVTLLVDAFTFESATVGASSATTPEQFNIIQSDPDPEDGTPDCPSTAVRSVKNLTVSSPVVGLLYSPCAVDFGGGTTTWNGQLFLKAIDDPGNSTVYYTPITDLPGALNPMGFAGGVTTKTTTTKTSMATVPTSIASTITTAPSMDPSLAAQAEP